MADTSQPTFHIVTLGCSKNRVDSEGMGRLLSERGLAASDDPGEAQVLIVNTCGFLAASRAESVGVIRDLLDAKRDDQLVIASGCMPALPARRAELPEGVDAIISTHEWDTIGDVVGNLLELPEVQVAGCQGMLTSFRRIEAGPSAYVKIADGCDHNCHFCTIPIIKGRQVSKRPSDVVREISELVAGGTKEAVLVAQDTIRYGADLGIKHGLPKLLEMIVEDVPDLEWLRMLYIYPSPLTLRMVDVMAEHDILLPYLDMPIQHADKEVLRNMGRPSDVDMTRRLVDHARSKMPNVAMRTTFIVGYPGETDEQFVTLMDFVEDMEFDHVGVFTYSHEEGTKSALLPNPVPAEVAEERRNALMELQQGISYKKNQALIGQEMQVLVEAIGEIEDGVGNSEPITVGRARRHAPEVDGLVFIPGALPVGEMTKVVIQDASPYDLWAVAPDTPASRDELLRAGRAARRRSRRNHSIRPDQAGRLGENRKRRGRALPVIQSTPSET
ncbi:MAG TPA: 30S ribosomal protein S12 methylthiotransferase RimO [Thermomicrobiales bacterium]|nr:30S ribosomal protein S12 methylthiotransferase RimO [Thermomicrobiales bacterium]